MKTMKHLILALLPVLALSSCKKENHLDEFTQGVQITIEKGEKNAPEALGRIWFINTTVNKSDTLDIKQGWNSPGTIEHFSLNDGTEPIVLWLPQTGHNNRYKMYIRNYRTMGETGNENKVVGYQIEVPKGKIQKILIKQYKKKLSVYLNEKVLISDI